MTAITTKISIYCVYEGVRYAPGKLACVLIQLLAVSYSYSYSYSYLQLLAVAVALG